MQGANIVAVIGKLKAEVKHLIEHSDMPKFLEDYKIVLPDNFWQLSALKEAGIRRALKEELFGLDDLKCDNITMVVAALRQERVVELIKEGRLTLGDLKESYALCKVLSQSIGVELISDRVVSGICKPSLFTVQELKLLGNGPALWVSNQLLYELRANELLTAQQICKLSEGLACALDNFPNKSIPLDELLRDKPLLPLHQLIKDGVVRFEDLNSLTYEQAIILKDANVLAEIKAKRLTVSDLVKLNEEACSGLRLQLSVAALSYQDALSSGAGVVGGAPVAGLTDPQKPLPFTFRDVVVEAVSRNANAANVVQL